MSGCLENSGPAASNAASGATGAGFGGTAGGTLPSGGNVSYITITQALRSNVDSTSLLDLIGQNGEIGTNCPTINNCSCIFNWTTPNGIARQSLPQQPARVETNLLRCLFTQVDSNAAYFDVHIVINSANLVSNTLRVYMSAPNPALDPSSQANYLPVQRYMCNDIITHAQYETKRYGSGSGNLHDPLLWNMSYTYELYTTNLGADYGATATQSNGGVAPAGWECPLVPNDPSNPLYDYNIYSLAPVDRVNPANPNPLPQNADNTIWPNTSDVGLANCPTGAETTCEKYAINRNDFYLATFQSGTFKEPVCVIHSVGNFVTGSLNCGIDTSSANVVVQLGGSALRKNGADIIGFAAVPDVNEACPAPSAVTVPAGKKWAKVWRFKASLPARTIQDVLNPGDIGNLMCTNREAECFSNGTYHGATDTGAGKFVAGDNSNSIAYSNTPLGNPPTNPNGRTDTVCYNATHPHGSNPGGIGPQATGVIAGTNIGFGNCDQSGFAGDTWGDSTLISGNYFNIPAGTACASGSPVFPNNGAEMTQAFNCCIDVGFPDFLAHNQNPNSLPANYTPGGSVCNPALIGSHYAEKDGGLASDNWLIGDGGRIPCIEADTDVNGKLWSGATFPPAQANPYVLGAQPIDLESKYDYIYVVTPTWVKLSDMQNPQGSTIAQQFTPWRYVPGSANGQKQVYGLDNGSSNTTNPTSRSSIFPLCVLQDAKQGVTLIPGGP